MGLPAGHPLDKLIWALNYGVGNTILLPGYSRGTFFSIGPREQPQTGLLVRLFANLFESTISRESPENHGLAKKNELGADGRAFRFPLGPLAANSLVWKRVLAPGTEIWEDRNVVFRAGRDGVQTLPNQSMERLLGIAAGRNRFLWVVWLSTPRTFKFSRVRKRLGRFVSPHEIGRYLISLVNGHIPQDPLGRCGRRAPLHGSNSGETSLAVRRSDADRGTPTKASLRINRTEGESLGTGQGSSSRVPHLPYEEVFSRGRLLFSSGHYFIRTEFHVCFKGLAEHCQKPKKNPWWRRGFKGLIWREKSKFSFDCPKVAK